MQKASFSYFDYFKLKTKFLQYSYTFKKIKEISIKEKVIILHLYQSNLMK